MISKLTNGLCAVAALAFFGCPAVNAQQTKILKAEKHNEYGLIYSLPSTALEIEVTAVKQTFKGGPYYQYAKKYVGTDKVIMEDSDLWSIESVKITPYGVADPESEYLMQLKPGALTYIGVADDGMLLSINTEPEALPKRKNVTQNEEVVAPTGKEYLQYVGEDFIAAQSSFKQAQMLAEELMEIREAKRDLTRGTAETMPTDGKQLELMLNSLAQEETALMQAFTGSETRCRITRSFTYLPSEEGKNVLFRLSDFDGFVAADDYSGEPVYINVKVTNEGELPTDDKGEAKKMPKDAVAYCIPGTAEISLSFNGKNIYSKEFQFAQFGVVFGLNPAIFTDKKDPSCAVFDPITGNVKEIKSMKKE